MTGVLRRDAAGLGAFVEAEGARLYSFAYVLTRDRSSAEDLVQAALLKFWTAKNDVQQPVAYVRRMMVNDFLNQRRSENRGRRLGHALVPDSSRFDAAVVEREAIRDAVTKLSRRQQVAVVLRYFEDFDDTEIASVRLSPADRLVTVSWSGTPPQVVLDAVAASPDANGVRTVLRQVPNSFEASFSAAEEALTSPAAKGIQFTSSGPDRDFKGLCITVKSGTTTRQQREELAANLADHVDMPVAVTELDIVPQAASLGE